MTTQSRWTPIAILSHRLAGLPGIRVVIVVVFSMLSALLIGRYGNHLVKRSKRGGVSETCGFACSDASFMPIAHTVARFSLPACGSSPRLRTSTQLTSPLGFESVPVYSRLQILS